MPTITYIPKPERLSPDAIQLLESYREWCMVNQKVKRESFKKIANKISEGVR